MLKRIIAIVVLTGVLLWLYPYVNKDIGKAEDRVKEEAVAEAGGDTNFVQEGLLTFGTANVGQDTPYLSYRASGTAPTTTVELLIDEKTLCSMLNGTLPCMAMSIQYHLPFGNKRAVVVGVEREARLTARVIRILE